jgi:mediator of RNA polymerase II transcription subunit 31
MATIFENDLEFIQLLCNPEYLKWLNNEKYFENNEFKEYLRYLGYFKDPKYTKFLIYPHCLAILDILNDEDSQKYLSSDKFYSSLEECQQNLWKFRD